MYDMMPSRMYLSQIYCCRTTNMQEAKRIPCQFECGDVSLETLNEENNSKICESTKPRKLYGDKDLMPSGTGGWQHDA